MQITLDTVDGRKIVVDFWQSTDRPNILTAIVEFFWSLVLNWFTSKGLSFNDGGLLRLCIEIRLLCCRSFAGMQKLFVIGGG